MHVCAYANLYVCMYFRVHVIEGDEMEVWTPQDILNLRIEVRMLFITPSTDGGGMVGGGL